ncbi:MAG: FecR domain-containing protein [Bacteriovoracaceae bacterium]
MKNIFALLLFLPFSLYAQNFSFDKKTGKAVPNFVAELKLMKGRALKTTGGRPRAVKVGEKFYAKDIIATEAESSMKLLVTDDTWLSLGPDSELVFTEFEYTDKTDRKISYELKKGQLSANVRQKINSGGVNFRSRFASMGVRGTKVMMNFRELKGSALAVTEYALVEGKAEVIDNKGETHELNAGERIVVIEDQKNKSSQLEKLNLTKDELDSFTSPEADEDKNINPFMPYYEPKAQTVSAVTPKEEKKAAPVESTTSGQGTFQNLEKLNDQLKENQKKRR